MREGQKTGEASFDTFSGEGCGAVVVVVGWVCED